MGDWHEDFSNTMLAVVFIHLAGVLVSSVLHRENLVRSMITGYKRGNPDAGIARTRWWVAALLVVLVALGWTMSRW